MTKTQNLIKLNPLSTLNSSVFLLILQICSNLKAGLLQSARYCWFLGILLHNVTISIKSQRVFLKSIAGKQKNHMWDVPLAVLLGDFMVTSVKGIEVNKDLNYIFELKKFTAVLTLSRCVTVSIIYR